MPFPLVLMVMDTQSPASRLLAACYWHRELFSVAVDETVPAD